ncbi:nuclear transport factor 2 family protein [Chitinophaga sp.]|uniref:nuclear transport factor 2 family protein n=1 Tax=Chitinophaga sp. TaxID=1869181 RepID=UPI0031CF8093
MQLNKIVTRLIAAQNSHDSQAYAACFTAAAIVHDEGKIYSGQAAIERWIADSNQQYQAVMKPLNYEETATEHLLTAEVSGNFPGSPAILHFHLGLEGDLIRSLEITG